MNPDTSPAPPTSHQRLLGALVVGTWLLTCALAFWAFQLRWIQPYGALNDNRFVSFVAAGGQIPPPVTALNGQPVIAHLIDPDCPCTRFSLPHIAQLDQRYEPNVQLVRIYATEALTTPLEHWDATWIPASPAVAIWDSEGQLAYLGPYTSGAICGEGEDLVARVMAQLAKGDNPRWVHQNAVGCFCPWPA